MSTKIMLTKSEIHELIKILQSRFEKNNNPPKDLNWSVIEEKLLASPQKLWSLNQMEITGGEPNVISYNSKTDRYLFVDCSVESPKGRRSLCYDRIALESRKEHKPKNTVIDMANTMGIELLNEEQYRELQKLGDFDLKTSSWLTTPDEVRKLGGAIFGDYRFGRVFIYHNGAESYYAARGFRGFITI